MIKYSYEEKLEAVLRVVEDGMSLYASAKIIGTSREHLRRWVARYNQFGSDALRNKLSHSSYDGDFKVSVIEYMHKNHLSAFQVAIQLGIPSEDSIRKWEKIYNENGAATLSHNKRGQPKKMKPKSPKRSSKNEKEKELLKEIQRLRMENEYLKKLQALVQERIARENGNEPPSSEN